MCPVGVRRLDIFSIFSGCPSRGIVPVMGHTSTRRTVVAVVGAAGLLAGLTVAATTATAATAAPGKPATGACHLGNGIKHVVNITFDNVHYYRDNPNVPSDLEMMPNLLHFIENNGTMLTNNHTPLIAHTADDILTTYTGLYGDRQGMPIANDYQVYNPDGTTDSAGSFAYWTDPVYDTSSKPNPAHDTNPNMVYSPVPPATAKTPVSPTTVTPAPWVPFTRAGCDVGEVATANSELENTGVDIPKVFGVNSPEYAQLKADPDPYKDAETADYVGLGVHCARGNAFCADAKAIKYGQSTPSASAVADSLPDEPGGYAGYQALFGHKYVAPQLGAGTPGLSRNGYEITNAAGDLVDLDGNQLNGAYLNDHPGFPGYDLTAPQSLAYTADMLESGVPVVYSYISDIHGNEDIPALSGVCAKAPDALGSGSPCYVAQARYYNQAFGTFFQRLAKDGITARNTLFVVSSDEGDHEAAANTGRALTPTPAGCDGATVSGSTVTPDVTCSYAAGALGELDANVTGLLATEKNDTTSFTVEADTAPEFYVTGNPAATDRGVRQLERDVSTLTADNPYTGSAQTIANYLADPTEEAILHMVNADPARTPTFALFAKPDYYLYAGGTSCAGACVSVNDGYAWNHGDYAAEINTNYVGFAGPGVRRLGLDGNEPWQGPNSAGADSGQLTVAETHLRGPWTDETDIRPTLMYLTGLKDDYIEDGRVITQVVGGRQQPGLTQLGACYKQLNSSVGDFAAATLIADTKAVESSGNSLLTSTDAKLRVLETARDALAIQIKDELHAAEFGNARVTGAGRLTGACAALIAAAERLTSS
jgi:hypothetical protein